MDLCHTQKLCLQTYNRQSSTNKNVQNRNIDNIINLMIFNFTIRGKLSIIRNDKKIFLISYILVLVVYFNKA